jgi:hypothetical protein
LTTVRLAGAGLASALLVPAGLAATRINVDVDLPGNLDVRATGRLWLLLRRNVDVRLSARRRTTDPVWATEDEEQRHGPYHEENDETQDHARGHPRACVIGPFYAFHISVFRHPTLLSHVKSGLALLYQHLQARRVLLK